jgi:hypothetical protein
VLAARATGELVALATLACAVASLAIIISVGVASAEAIGNEPRVRCK